MSRIGGTIVAGGVLALLGAFLGAVADPSAAASPQSAQSRTAFRFDGPMIQGGTVLGTAPA